MKSLTSYLFRALLALGIVISFDAYAQTTTTATYSAGMISSEFQNNPDTSNNSACSATLTVNVPVGRFVTSIDVDYDIEAVGFNFINEQRSYLECVTTGNKESSVTPGNPLSGFGGTEAYSRTGLSIANGVVPTGGLQFELHVFRTFGAFGGCNTTAQRVPNNTWTITVHHIPAPSCLPPTNPSSSNITSNSASLNWTTGGATDWQIEYGAPGFVQGTGTFISAVGSNPFTLTSLTPNTSYEYIVRDSCGPGDVSIWSGRHSFRTACVNIMAPWTEDFESSDWQTATGFGGLGDIDTCWERNYTNGFTWVPGPPVFPSAFTGPSGDHTTGSGQYMYSDQVGFGIPFPMVAEMETPSIDLSNLTVPELSFWFHMFGGSIGDLDVSISDNGGTSFTNLVSKSGQQQTSKAAAWIEEIVNLSAYANKTVILKFTVTQNLFGAGEVAIDDISIYEQPSCTKPSNLSATANTANSVTVSWTTGGATNWQIEYGAPGFTPGSGTLLSATTNPFTITGLSPSSAYDIYVRDSCGVGDVSFWVGPLLGNTACATVLAPYSENFDNANWTVPVGFNGTGTVDTCWPRTFSTNLVFVTGPPTFTFGSGAANDHTTGSGKYIFSEQIGFAFGADTAVIVSPEIDLSPLTVPELTFWYHMFGFNIEDLNVYISDNGGSTYTSIFSLTGAQQNSDTDPWKEAIVNLSAYANSTVKIKYEVIQTGFGGNGNVCIDDFDIHEAPTCSKPQNLAVDFVWLDRATISWTTGGATNWEIEYGSPGFAIGSGTRVATTSNPHTLTSLSPNTAYDVYVRDSCGAGDVSVWVGPLRVNTLCLPATTPYFEDFAGNSFSAGPTFNDTGTVDPCWDRNPVSSFVWKGGPPIFPPFGTGPDKDHTTGLATGEYVFTESIGFSTNTPISSDLESDLIDISGLAAPQLTFWYHMFGNDIGSLEVYVSNGGAYNLERTITGSQQTSRSDAWIEGIVSLASYIGDTIRVKFVGTKTTAGFGADIAIDDVEIDEAPSCPKPQLLNIVGKTNTSVTLQWVTGGATQWNIEYGSPGFAPGTGTYITANSNPFTVTSLSASTGYEFYVRDSCGNGNSSEWVGPVGDTTDCNPVSAPYLEDFEGTSWTIGIGFTPGNIDQCWNRDEQANYIWTPGTGTTFSFNTGPSGDHTTGSGQYLYSEGFFGFNQTTMTTVETGLIDLSPLNVPELSYWYHMFGGDIDSLTVDVFDGSSWTSISSFAGQQQTSSTAAWKEEIVSLAAFANDTVKLRFNAYKATGFAQAVDIAIDDVDIHEQPACPQPSNLVVTGSTGTSVTLSWTTGGSTMWQIEYGAPGFALGTGTKINVTTNPYTVTGLNSSSTYDFYVRDSCMNDTSGWFGPVAGSTSCDPLVAPFLETFDGSNFVQASSFGDTGTMAVCWDRNPVTGFFWAVGPPTFATFGTGPSGDHTTGSGSYMFTESAGFGTAPFNTEFETPWIDLTALTDPELSFWYHMFGTGIGDLDVEVDDGSGYSNVISFSGAQHTSNTDPWKEAIVSLTTYANDTIRLRFKGSKPGFSFQSEIAVDDIEIDEAPQCPKPSLLASTSATATSITLSWTTGGATNWQIEYGAPGFALGSGTLINVTSNPYTITNLTPNTIYDIYVRDSCGVGSVSDWSTVSEDTTLCSVFSAPYTENFDGAAWGIPIVFNDPGTIDQCWARNSTSGFFFRPGQGATTSFNTGPSGDHTTGTGKYVYSEQFGFNSPTGTNITSPEIDLSTLTTPELRFWYHMFGGNIDKLEVRVKPVSASTWTVLGTITGQQQTATTAAWLESVMSLSAYANDTIQVRFRAVRTTGFGTQADMAIDDVWIGDSPTCANPTNLTSTTQTTTSITVSWTAGGATNWLVKYRPSGSGGPFTIVSAPTNPFTITSLMPSTSYEIYVRDSCGTGDVSFWEGPLFENTLCGVVTAPYSENFDGGSWVSGTGFTNANDEIDDCWTRSTNTGLRWGTRTGTTLSFGTGPNNDVSGAGNYIYIEGGLGNGPIEIEGPEIYIPPSMSSPKLYFSYHFFGNNIQSFNVKVHDGSVWSGNLLTINGSVQSANADPWEVDSVDLTSYIGDTIKFRFTGDQNGFQGDMAIDEVSISSPTTVIPCFDPTNIAFSNIGITGFDVSWASSLPTSTVEVVELGLGQGNGTTFFNATSPLTVTNLNANTSYEVFIRDSCGATNLSNWITDTVLTLPCPTVTASFTYLDNLLNVNFNSVTTVNADSLHWDYGDGNQANGPSPSHSYLNPGSYTVTLIAMNNCGNSDTAILNIEVCDSLLADFTITEINDTIHFDAGGSTGASQYIWDFGDSSGDTGVAVSHFYSSPTIYTVTLTAKNACGDSVVVTKTVKICLEPVASWTYTIISTGANGMQVQFDGSASQNATVYKWDFGDGNTNNTSALPIHTYAVPGLFYKVTLIVENNCGDDDTLAFRLNEIGIEELNFERSLKIYPNPASEGFNVEWDGAAGPERLVLRDMTGRAIREMYPSSDEISSGKTYMETRDLPDGMYFVELYRGEAIIRRQLMVRE